MHNTISKLTRTEILEALRQRYQQAPNSEKTKVCSCDAWALRMPDNCAAALQQAARQPWSQRV